MAKLLVLRKQANGLAWVDVAPLPGAGGAILQFWSGFQDRQPSPRVSDETRARMALEAPWTDFRKHPSKFSYEDLMKPVPETERAEWHVRAMDGVQAHRYWICR